jgi:hypothetical protein
MHTIDIPEAKETLYLPQTLAECDKLQYIEMCELIFRYQTGMLSYFDLKTQAVYKLLNLKPSKKELLIVDEEAKWGNVYTLSGLIDSFFDDVDGQKVIRLEFTHNPVPSFAPLWKTYHGPRDTFMNVSFGEYLDGLRLYLDFAVTGNMQLLYLMAAVFYRKARPFTWLHEKKGDIREPYRSDTVENRVIDLKVAPIGFIYGFYLLFASFQKYITTAVIPWGGRELDLSILFEGDSGSTLEAVPGIGMDSLAFALAESGAIGNLEAVRKTNLWEIFIRLYDLKKKDLDYKLNDKSKSS